MSSLVRDHDRPDGTSEHQAKRQRMTGGDDGPIEDDETARRKLAEAGFDPDKISDTENLRTDSFFYAWDITPMIYFSFYGDLKMCRYLYAHGAETSFGSFEEQGQDAPDFWFPMYASAQQGHLDVCKWLYDHGADGDVRRHNEFGHSPLSCAASRCDGSVEYRKICKWLILNGAVHDESGEINTAILRRDLTPYERGRRIDERHRFLSWAKDVLQVHDGFQAFLMGTLAPPEKASLGHARRYRTRYQTRYESPVRCFSGNTGVLERISDFVGIYSGKKIRIFRQLAKSLSQ